MNLREYTEDIRCPGCQRLLARCRPPADTLGLEILVDPECLHRKEILGNGSWVFYLRCRRCRIDTIRRF